MVESPAIFPRPYQKVREIEDAFDVIFTFSDELLWRGPPYRYAPLGGCWIREPRIYDKTRSTSIIVSEKTKTRGHKLRHEVLRRDGAVDGFGRGANHHIAAKEDGLCDYRFSYAIENTQHEYYFTEKLIDCFATGTVPLYWGPDLGATGFDTRGIIEFNDLDDLVGLETSSLMYAHMLPAIRHNLEVAKRYMVTEDRLWEDHLREIVEGA